MGKTFRLLAGCALATTWAEAVAHRLRREYAATGTFNGPTVGLLYSAYVVEGAAFVAAARSRRPPLPLPGRASRVAGSALAVLGGWGAVGGMRRFGSAAQVSGTEPGALVTDGPYRFTRNPQYLGLVACLAGVSMATRSGPAAMLTAVAWSTLDRWIPSEEAHLVGVFGSAYTDYAGRVPRWA